MRRSPTELARLGFRELSSAVVPLADARFYHLGSSRQLFDSMEQLQQGLSSAGQIAPHRLSRSAPVPRGRFSVAGWSAQHR